MPPNMPLSDRGYNGEGLKHILPAVILCRYVLDAVLRLDGDYLVAGWQVNFDFHGWVLKGDFVVQLHIGKRWAGMRWVWLLGGSGLVGRLRCGGLLRRWRAGLPVVFVSQHSEAEYIDFVAAPFLPVPVRPLIQLEPSVYEHLGAFAQILVCDFSRAAIKGEIHKKHLLLWLPVGSLVFPGRCYPGIGYGRIALCVADFDIFGEVAGQYDFVKHALRPP